MVIFKRKKENIFLILKQFFFTSFQNLKKCLNLKKVNELK